VLRGQAQLGDQLDQRLGGATPLLSARPAVPAGFVATPVAAGLTAPYAVAAAADGTLYLAEGGHPRRTPPRLLAIDPRTGVASVLDSFDSPPALAVLAEAWAGGAVLLAAGGQPWRAALMGRTAAEPHPGGAAFLQGVAVHAGALYFCDPGTPAPDGLPAAGTGILWRVAPAGWSAAEPTARARSAPLKRMRSRSPAHVFTIGVVALCALGVGLAWYYRERRASGRRYDAT